MSTRAMYTFKGDGGDYNVYKHHDGYPTGAAQTLADTIKYFSWCLPRYESDEFAAGFCAAGKAYNMIRFTENTRSRADFDQYQEWNTGGGGVRLLPSGDPVAVYQQHCPDISYRYEIWMENEALQIICVSIYQTKVLYKGAFDKFDAWAKRYEKRKAA